MSYTSVPPEDVYAWNLYYLPLETDARIDERIHARIAERTLGLTD